MSDEPIYVGDYLKAIPVVSLEEFSTRQEAAQSEKEMHAHLILSMSTRTAAVIFGISHSTVARMKRDAGVVRITGSDGKVRPSKDEPEVRRIRDAEIRRLFAEGQSMRFIAQELSCSVGTVHRVIKAAR